MRNYLVAETEDRYPHYQSSSPDTTINHLHPLHILAVPPRFLSNEYQVLFTYVQSGRSVTLSTHLHIVLRFTVCKDLFCIHYVLSTYLSRGRFADAKLIFAFQPTSLSSKKRSMFAGSTRCPFAPSAAIELSVCVSVCPLQQLNCLCVSACALCNY
jgi:hypothetical protein